MRVPIANSCRFVNSFRQVVNPVTVYRECTRCAPPGFRGRFIRQAEGNVRIEGLKSCPRLLLLRRVHARSVVRYSFPFCPSTTTAVITVLPSPPARPSSRMSFIVIIIPQQGQLAPVRDIVPAPTTLVVSPAVVRCSRRFGARRSPHRTQHRFPRRFAPLSAARASVPSCTANACFE